MKVDPLSMNRKNQLSAYNTDKHWDPKNKVRSVDFQIGPSKNRIKIILQNQ